VRRCFDGCSCDSFEETDWFNEQTEWFHGVNNLYREFDAAVGRAYADAAQKADAKAELRKIVSDL